MTTNCGKCGRPLKDPKSVERGFGPTCWGEVSAGITRTAGAKGKSTADFTYHINRSAGHPVLVIEDIDRGGTSVTNDIENVVADIAEEIGLNIYNMPVVYRDSTGRYDGVNAADLRGGIFYSLGRENEQDAVLAALERKGEKRE